MKTKSILFLLCLTGGLHAEPLLTSWNTKLSRQYARIYESKAAALAGDAVATWSNQTLPAYSDIQKVEVSNDWVYVTATGLASHFMGPWYFDLAKTRLFDNLPVNQNITDRFPRVPSVASTKTGNYLNSLGRWSNGVALFNMLDGAFYANGTESQDGGQGVQTAYWIRNAMAVEVVTFDNTNGHQPPSGDYHYHADPKALRYQLGDNITFTPVSGSDNAGVYTEDTTNLKHSPILGWSYDGYPVYGPYGYDDPSVASTDPTIRRIKSGFVPRDGEFGTDNIAVTGRNSLAKWSAEMRGLSATGTTYPISNTNQRGPAVTSTYVIGYWVEDFAFLGNLGYIQETDFDLDLYNGRFCRTPEYPRGTYAYFVTIDENSQPAFPYVVGRQWYGNVTGGSVATVDEATTVLVEAGPDSQTRLRNLEADTAASEVTLTWSSVEGGHYLVEASRDLENWEPIGSDLAATAVESAIVTPMSETETEQFYQVTLTSVDEYDAEGSGGTGPGGGGPMPGSGNPTEGFVFAFPDGPPMANLISNLRVGNVTGTVVNYALNGPTGGTITISFNASTFASGSSYPATFTHAPPGSGSITATSTNSYPNP